MSTDRTPVPCRTRVVIPCRNESAHIGRLLKSLIEADRQGIDLQVLVCDGMSDDGTRDIVQAMVKEHPQIRLVDNIHRTTPQALNIGLKDLRFDVGIIVGAHAEVDRYFLTGNIRVLNEHPEAGCAGGIIENIYEGRQAELIGMAMAHPFGVGNAHFRTGRSDGNVDTVAFGAYRREVFEKAGLFDETLVRNQDDEFNYRVISAGYKIRLDRSIRSKYYVRGSWRKLYRQYYQYGFWKVYVNLKHRTVTTLRQLVPALLVSYMILGAVIAALFPVLIPPYAAGIAIYLIASIMAARDASQKIADIPGVAMAFWILHFAYGLGYLNGILTLGLLRKHPGERSKAVTR